MVVVTVETNLDEVEVTPSWVAADKASRDRIRIVEHGPDVDRGIVVRHADLGALGPRLSLGRVLLDEVRYDWCLGPNRLVESAIQINLGLSASGTRPGTQIVVVVSLDRPFGSRSRLGAFLARTDQLSLDSQRRQEQDESKQRFRGYSHVGSSLSTEKRKRCDRPQA